ncbi:MAG: Fe-S cluster assembly protein SufB, partial [Neomegalonema sp.]
MAALDQVTVKDGVEEETGEKVRSLGEKYKDGFEADIETEFAPKGLNEDIVRLISEKKTAPEWLLEWRLEAFERWKAMPEPEWAMVSFPPIDYQEQYYYAQPKSFK